MTIEWHVIENDLIEAWENRPHIEQKILRWTRQPITEGRLINRFRPASAYEDKILRHKIESLVEQKKLSKRIKKHGRSNKDFAVYQNLYVKKMENDRHRAMGIMMLQPGSALTFDVSQPCDMLLIQIQEACRQVEWHMPAWRLEATLSADKEMLTVARSV